jgi:putative transposase
MARIARIFIENACYHIITRGNQKQAVFRGETDFRIYLNILGKAKTKNSIKLYAYCLMPNHVHLLIEPATVKDMSAFMHWLNRGYAAQFNNRHGTVGHIWQGRFVSKPIIKGSYLINCVTYIEANPVRASFTNDLAGYPWTSYAERCLLSKKSLLDEMLFNEWSGAMNSAMSGTG